MSDITLVTFDWVPDMPRGLVRDLRVRWALEEAGLPYKVERTSFRDRGAAHFRHQPFGQVPWLRDGALSIFESGAILLHIARKNTSLLPLPQDAQGQSDVTMWLFAALNSVEMAVLPYALLRFSDAGSSDPGAPGGDRQVLESFLAIRLRRMEEILRGRTWLADGFSVADIAMSDVLRLAVRFDALADYPACRAYLARALGRSAFQKAHADQMAHFAAAD